MSGGSQAGAVSEAVAKVDQQLQAFWSTNTDEAGNTKARAATMNFVALSASSEADGVRERIDELAQTRAGRAFLMTVSGALAPWDLESDVSTVCHKQGETVVCYDRIELKFGAMVAPRAPSVLSALALSEVPTIVEIGRGAASSLVDSLVKVATRVIVDSAHTGVGRLAELAGKTRAPLADRAFVRTFTWRELCARFFDDAPAAAGAIGRVEIDRANPADRAGSGDPAAILLGWLGSRLGWRFASASAAVDADGRPVEIAVGTAGDASGELHAVRMVSALEGRPLFCSATRAGKDRIVRFRVSGPRASSHDVPLGYRDEGWVLGKAIDGVEGDRVYRAALLAAAEWSRLAEATS